MNEIFERKLKEREFDIIDINTRPYEITVLPNGYLVAANNDNGQLTLYDSNFNLVKSIDKISNQAISPWSITHDEKNKIYISNYACRCIISTDLDFNFIKSQKIEWRPYGICYKNQIVYVCDFNNYNLHKYSSELVLLQTIKLEIKPWTIKILNDTACINYFGTSELHFYDLDTFSFKAKYIHGPSRQAVFNSLFYEFERNSQKIYCYDDEGNLLRELEIDKIFNEFFKNGLDGCIALFNDYVVVSSHSQKKLLRIPLKKQI